MRVQARIVRWMTLLVVLLACLWGVQGTAGFAQRPAPQTHSILIKGFKYQPDVLTVKVGDTVLWKNEDMVPHTITAVDRSFDSGRIAPGSTWKLVVKKAGTYLYNCSPHPNMHGKLIVQ